MTEESIRPFRITIAQDTLGDRLPKVRWNVHDAPAGHYAAHVAPDVLAADIGTFFRSLRESRPSQSSSRRDTA